MIEFSEIIERIKDIISNEKQGKIRDKDVAEVLGMSARNLRVYKAANIHPFENLCLFAVKYNISLDWLLFERDFKVKKREK